MWTMIKGWSGWTKISAWCWHSLTVAWAYLQILAAAALVGIDQGLEGFASALNDPAVVGQIKPLLPPQWVGYLVGFIGVITLLARLRSLIKKVG
jgi:hypothetical protein